MKQILVTGGTGTLGKEVVSQLIDERYYPKILSSRMASVLPVGASVLRGDLTEKNSFQEVAAQAEIIIHCASNPRNSENVDIAGTRNLLEALNPKKSPHLIFISIVGADKNLYPYYQHKCIVEKMIMNSPFSWSILRVSQFHDFVLSRIIQPLEQGIDSFLLVPQGLQFQSIAVTDVASHIVNLVSQGPTRTISQVGGPEILSLEVMIKTYQRVLGKQRKMKNIQPENDFYKLFQSGKNLCPENRIGHLTWDTFISTKVKTK